MEAENRVENSELTQDVKFRHELKYSISNLDYMILRARLKPIMQADANVKEDGTYTIRSIYFDNYRDKALHEKVDGVAKREKFRIRYYNDDWSYIALEKKMKINQLCRKLDATLTEEECRKLLDGDTSWMLSHPEELVREFYLKMRNEQLRPRVLVSYTREPFIYHAGNVRVTFDSNIRSTLFHNEFMEPDPIDIKAVDIPDQIILEVKYDEFLPEIIAKILQLGNCRQIAFSKYGTCRRFG